MKAPQRYLVPILPTIFFSATSIPALKPLSYLLNGYHGFFQGIILSGREADHSLQSGVEIQVKYSCTSASSVFHVIGHK
jgi:hypothetical protein